MIKLATICTLVYAITMRFIEAAAFLWSLSTAASFGIQRQPGASRHHQSNSQLAFTPGHTSNGLPFVIHRGGQSSSKSKDSSSALAASVVSDTVTEENLAVLSERGRQAVQNLVDYDKEGSQAHVYGGWPEAGVEDEGKKKLADQVRSRCDPIYINPCLSPFPRLTRLLYYTATAGGSRRILSRRPCCLFV